VTTRGDIKVVMSDDESSTVVIRTAPSTLEVQEAQCVHRAPRLPGRHEGSLPSPGLGPTTREVREVHLATRPPQRSTRSPPAPRLPLPVRRERGRMRVFGEAVRG
jgi:hypothetical protein